MARKKVSPCPQQKITDLNGKYWFDQKAVDRVVWFFSKLKHTNTPWTGQPFKFMPWTLRDFISPLFGWKRVDDNTRRFRRAYLGIPKKNAKSALASGIGNYLFMGDGEYGAEVYAAANERGQAGIVFGESKKQLRYSDLRRLVSPNPIKDSTKTLLFPATSSKYTTLSRESSTKDGMSIHGLLFDELHALREPALYHVLTQGSGAARRQPLHITITTAGSDRTSICFSEYEAAKKVIEDEKYDEELLGVIYEADPKDDWTDPEVWKKANPSLGETLTLRDMEHDCMVAQKKPSVQNEFKRLRLNLWTSQITRWLNMSDWDKCGRKYTEEVLRGLPCFGGLDLSTRVDLTAFVLAFPMEDAIRLWPYIFIPQEKIEENSRRDRVPYDRWVSEGHIIATPGNVVDYDAILAKVSEGKKLFELQSISYDPWNANAVFTGAEKLGVPMITVGQNYPGMSPPSKEFERLLVSEKMYHPMNPCMTWAADNIEVRTGPGGVIAPNKPAEKAGSQKRIDPIVAGILSVERIARGVKPTKSVYESRGVRYL